MKIQKTKTFLKNQITDISKSNLFRLIKAKINHNTDLYKEILLLESRYNKNESENNKGTIPIENHKQEFNKINDAILNIIDSLKEEDLVESIVDEHTQDNHSNSEDEFEKRLKLFGLRKALKSEGGKVLYEENYKNLIIELERIMIKYCEISNFTFSNKTVQETKLYSIEKVTLKIMPCNNISKGLLWIEIEKGTDDNNKQKRSNELGVFMLDYSEEFNLVWRSEENKNIFFNNNDLSKLVNRKFFDFIMKDG